MKNGTQRTIKLSLSLYDSIVFAIAFVLILFLGDNLHSTTLHGLLIRIFCSWATIIGVRYAGNIYRQVWRYGGIQCYIKLLLADACSTSICVIINICARHDSTEIVSLIAFCCMDTLGALAIRMLYRYAFKCGSLATKRGAFLRFILRVATFGRVQTQPDCDDRKIKVAIVGAGSVGVALAEELIHNPKSAYRVRCFVDTDTQKVGRDIHGISVISEDEHTLSELRTHEIQEVLIAVPTMNKARRFEVYEFYKNAGFSVKVYDYPIMSTAGAKRQLREIEITDLLMRDEKQIVNDKTKEYYKGKTVLITGGGGSIGSELVRQLAQMEPKQLVVLDVYENGAYDLQQEIAFRYKGAVDIRIEIASIRDKKALDRCFRTYRPDICIHAAAHKHVPLMERNCVEAVENNVFGALNVVRCCEEFGCGRFMLVSTDKAVNPTNVMGATKRACEMIMQAYSTKGNVRCSATRFGNVLGSAGSVIPLFKKQIAAGGPVTLTDKRIIRYFMTIPEASQLVLISGAMAANGDLFVLDMGKPVSIYELAKNMISLSGAQNVEIIETGLRPGEKLYEELLIGKDDLEKTENSLIFIEHEQPVTMSELEAKLHTLRTACDADVSDIDSLVRDAMKQVVPTFKDPEQVNEEAAKKAVS